MFRSPPFAYLLTLRTFGTRLPGSAEGWVDRSHRAYGAPMLAESVQQLAYSVRCLNEPPWTMGAEERDIVLASILNVCQHRGWQPLAAHVRSNHMHAVIGGELVDGPEKMLIDFKAYATRALRTAGTQRERYWAKHGSTRYLWKRASVRAAIEYVLEQQGEPMACYATDL